MEVDMAKTRRKRHTYTAEKRAEILTAATQGGLTAAQVKRKYGVTPVTYYSWRKKTGLTARRGRGTTVPAVTGGDLTAHVRSEVQTKIRQILPGIVRTEVSHYLDSVFGAKRGRKVRV
jgi:transposase-like protein